MPDEPAGLPAKTEPEPGSSASGEKQSFYERWRVRLAPISLKLAPTERQRLFAVTIVVGGLCGLAAVAFHLFIDVVSNAAIRRALAAPGWSWIAWTLITPTAGGIVCGILLQYGFPTARGSGIPEIKVAYARKGGRLRFLDAVAKFVISGLQIGTGLALGREGPTVQMCAGIANGVGKVAGVSQRNLRRLLPVGAAAGIAAAFNAPIAAVTFTIEEVVGHLDQTILSGIIVAAALAAFAERSVLGAHPMLIEVQTHGLQDSSSLLLYAALGVVGAGVSIAFSDSLLGIRAFFKRTRRIPGAAGPAIGGLMTGGLAVIGVLVLHSTGVAGGGYETLASALSGKLVVRALIGLCILKLLATASSYGSGGAGGIFPPALFCGGMPGGAFGALDMAIFHHPASSMADFALVGMGAVFAGVIRAPMTSVLIIIEMTSGYSLILPLMIANMSSYGLARLLRKDPIYEALLAQDGIRLGPGGPPDPRDRILLSELPLEDGPPTSLTPSVGAVDMLKLSQQQRQQVFPVVDANGRLVGIVAVEDLAILASEPHLEGLVNAADVMRAPVAVRPDDNLRAAFEAMMANRVKSLPMIDSERRVIAMIDEASIARAYMQGRPTESA